MIEKLERYEGYYEDESSKPLALCQNGDYVLYKAVRTREDALLEALKLATRKLHTRMSLFSLLSFEQCPAPSCSHLREVIHDIETTR
jgi:hypothetical protein